MVREFLQAVLQAFVRVRVAFGVEVLELRLDVFRFVDEFVGLKHGIGES